MQLQLLGSSVPSNGVALCCSKDHSYTVHPPLPLLRAFYRCDSRFHVEMLLEMLEDRPTYGFVVCDGSNAIVATTCGDERNIIERVVSHAKSRSARGGSSAARFGRIRDIAEDHYIKAICEALTKTFTTVNADLDVRPCVSGIIIAGKAEIKQRVVESPFISKLLKPLLIGCIDVQHSGDHGLVEAIERAVPIIADLNTRLEDGVLASLFRAIECSPDTVRFGVRESIEALAHGCLESMFVSAAILQRATLSSLDLQDFPQTLWKDTLLSSFLPKACVMFAVRLHVIPGRSERGDEFCSKYGVASVARFMIHNAEPSDPTESAPEQCSDECSQLSSSDTMTRYPPSGSKQAISHELAHRCNSEPITLKASAELEQDPLASTEPLMLALKGSFQLESALPKETPYIKPVIISAHVAPRDEPSVLVAPTVPVSSAATMGQSDTRPHHGALLCISARGNGAFTFRLDAPEFVPSQYHL